MATYVSILDFSCSQIRIQRLTEQEERDYHEVLENDGEALLIHLGYKLDNISFMITDDAPELLTNFEELI